MKPLIVPTPEKEKSPYIKITGINEIMVLTLNNTVIFINSDG